MSNNNKWGALSMKDRAFLIRQAVKNGITDVGEVKNLYQESHQFDGNQDNLEKTLKSSYPSSTISDKANHQVMAVPIKYTYPEKNLSRQLDKKATVQDFSDLMYPIIQQEMAKNNYPMDNIDNIMRQAALESNYGRDTRGNGFNYAGIKVQGEDKEKLGTKHSDGFYYRNFDNNAHFADWYLDLLNNRYDALNATSKKDYINRLHDGQYKYSADKKAYRKNFARMSSLENALENTKRKHQFGGDGNNKHVVTDYSNKQDNSFIEKLAYNIGSRPGIKEDGKLTLKTVREAITGVVDTVIGKEPYEYNDLRAFLGHPEEYGYTLTEDTTGPQFPTEMSKYPEGTIKTYKGVINPYNEYVVTEDNYNKFVDMAKRGEIFYSNADMEALDYLPDKGNPVYLNTGHRADAQNYPIQFVLEEGKLYANAADLYDFDTSSIQGRLLTRYGNPYIRRHNKIPVRAVSVPEDFLHVPKSSFNRTIDGILLTEDMKRARNMDRIVKVRESEK